MKASVGLQWLTSPWFLQVEERCVLSLHAVHRSHAEQPSTPPLVFHGTHKAPQLEEPAGTSLDSPA